MYVGKTPSVTANTEVVINKNISFLFAVLVIIYHI